MKLLVYLEKEENNLDYIVEEDGIFISSSVNSSLKEKYNDNYVSELVRKNYRDKGYFYNNSDVEACFFDNLEELRIVIDENVKLSEVVRFINKNKDNFKKVSFSIPESKYDELDSLLKLKNDEKLSFQFENNDREISVYELKMTINTIDSMTKNLDGLSDLENIMYIYDKVRDKVYCDDSLDKQASRDLSKVLLGDKIVCLGYAQVFNILLKKLNINSTVEILINNKNPKIGHARNIVCINDSKYNLKDALLLFDLTYDSKKDTDDNSFLNSYRFFAKPLSFFKKLDHNIYSSATLNFFDNDNWSDKIVGMSGIDSLSSTNFLHTMNNCYRLLGKKANILNYINLSNLSINYKRCIDDYQELADCFEKKLSKDDFTRCLINVRNFQNEEDNQKYKNDFDSIVNTVYNTYRTIAKDDRERKILEIFDLTFNEKNALEITKKYMEEKGKTKQKKKNN